MNLRSHLDKGGIFVLFLICTRVPQKLKRKSDSHRLLARPTKEVQGQDPQQSVITRVPGPHTTQRTGNTLGKNISVSGLQGKLSGAVWIICFLHQFLTWPFRADPPDLGRGSHDQKLKLAYIRPGSRPMSAMFSFLFLWVPVLQKGWDQSVFKLGSGDRWGYLGCSWG